MRVQVKVEVEVEVEVEDELGPIRIGLSDSVRGEGTGTLLHKETPPKRRI